MYQIITDGSWDMGSERAANLGIEVVPYYVTMDGEHYLKEIEELDVRDFYSFMVENPKIFPKTSLPSIPDYMNVFEKYARQGIDMICFTLSSKFSGSYNAAQNASAIIQEQYPDIRITVVDSTLATLMQGLMIQELVRYQRSGADYDTLLSRAAAIIGTARIFFTVENMDYLIHGGRVGKLAGISANVLNLRPMILMTQGELFSSGLARGRAQSRKKAMENLFDHIRKNGNDPNAFAFIVGYGYNKAEGEALREDVIQHFKKEWPDYEPTVDIGQIGATIGVHTGPHPLGFGLIEKSC
jgi:DegV family protein with EDD domain